MFGSFAKYKCFVRQGSNNQQDIRWLSLREKLEERAKLAFESEDAMHLAGILYLAKEMKMPIRYIDNLRNGIFDGEAKEFIPMEEQGEPVAFDIGGAAYLKQ